MESLPKSFLVMDANQRSALAVTRSLGRQYSEATIITADTMPRALAGASKYSDKYITYPDPSTKPQDFVHWVAEHCKDSYYDLIIPTTEITSQCLLAATQQLPNLPLPFADHKTVMQVADKSKLVQAEEAAGLPVPVSAFFENSSQLPPIEQFAYPIVLKPSLSKIPTQSGWITTTVRIINNQEDLKATLRTDTYLKQHSFMLQEFIPGHGAGLFCLFNEGKPVQFFAHTRLREKPPQGGVSVLSQAAPIDKKLQALTVRLLKAVNWHGAAMVEFRIAEDGTAYLMEINTRFWGSLQLAIDSGVDFPAQLAAIHLGEKVAPTNEYNTDQRLRWLLGDLDSLYIYMKGNYSNKQKLLRIAAFLTPRFRNQRHEVNRLNDIKPFFTELEQYISSLKG